MLIHVFIALLVSAYSSVVECFDTDEMLHSRWNMDEPIITYFTETNTFILDFPTASPENTLDGMQHQFYDINCKWDGSDYTEYIIPNGIYGPDGTSAPQMTLDGPGGLPQLQFKIDTAVLIQDDKIYSVVDETMAEVQPTDDTTSTTNDNGLIIGTNNCVADDTERKLSHDRELYDFKETDIGKGLIRMCVRSSLGYTKDTGFKEVNFIESLIYVFYDFKSGFCVSSVTLNEKKSLETAVTKETYKLEAYLCDLSLPEVPRTISDRSLPAPIPATYMASSAGAEDATYFTQGALLRVCVTPTDGAYNEGIRMDGLNEFTWKREDPSFIPEEIRQEAIVDGSAAGNFLTYYAHEECIGGTEYCTFASILFAEFYRFRGVVYGDGKANMVFATNRRRRLLGQPVDEQVSARRFLEEDDSRSSFDVAVSVTYTDNGPNSLVTAAGGLVSFAHSAVALITSLLSGVLLLI